MDDAGFCAECSTLLNTVDDAGFCVKCSTLLNINTDIILDSIWIKFQIKHALAKLYHKRSSKSTVTLWPRFYYVRYIHHISMNLTFRVYLLFRLPDCYRAFICFLQLCVVVSSVP